jgi:hypothetical protein
MVVPATQATAAETDRTVRTESPGSRGGPSTTPFPATAPVPIASEQKAAEAETAVLVDGEETANQVGPAEKAETVPTARVETAAPGVAGPGVQAGAVEMRGMEDVAATQGQAVPGGLLRYRSQQDFQPITLQRTTLEA